MHSCSPARTPKSQLVAEQPWTGECQIPPTKIPHLQKQRRSPNKMVGGTQSHLKSNFRHARDTQRVYKKHCAHQDPGKGAVTSTRDWTRPVFEYLSVSCRGMGQQWPAAGTGALAAGLGSVACGISPFGGDSHKLHYGAAEQTTHKLEAIIPKQFSPCCKNSRTHNRYPNLGIWQRDWQSSGNLTLKTSRIWLQYLPRTGETDSWRAQQNLVHARTQEKGAMAPQETEPDLPVSVWESLVEAWINSGVSWGQGHSLQQLGAGISPFEGDSHYPYHRLASGKTTGREHNPIHQQKTVLKID